MSYSLITRLTVKKGNNPGIDLQIQCNPYQSHSRFLRKTDKLILKFTDTPKGLRTAKTLLKILEKNKTQGLMLSDFKTSYKITLILQYYRKDISINQWNRI